MQFRLHSCIDGVCEQQTTEDVSVWSSLERELHLHRLGPIVRELKRVPRLSEGQGRRNQRLHIDHTLVDIVDRDPEFFMKSK
jgi:hypothetical protein